MPSLYTIRSGVSLFCSRSCDHLRMRRSTLFGVLAAAWLLPGSSYAHDYWMVPAQYVVPSDAEIALSLFVGEDFVAEDEKHFERSRTTRLAFVHKSSTEDLINAGVEGALPMLRVHAAGAGGHLVAFDRNASRIELEPKKFEAYLHDEGLDAVVAERARRGETAKPGRERYTRYLKALIQVADARDDANAAVVGQTLELSPEANPVFAAQGGSITWVVRFQGAPLEGAMIEALSRVGTDVRKAKYVSDAHGRINVAIDRQGVWLVRMVHMTRCEGCDDADWQSFWSSYSFASASARTVVAPDMLAPHPTSGRGWVTWAALATGLGVLASVAYVIVRRRRRVSP